MISGRSYFYCCNQGADADVVGDGFRDWIAFANSDTEDDHDATSPTRVAMMTR